MALAHSPKIVTDGLVFAYDMANTKKSWKGKPITNQFAIPTPAGDGAVSFQVQGSGTFYRIYSGNYGGYDIQPEDIVYKFSPWAYGGCWYHGNDVTINAGQTATWSFDYYVDPSITGYPYTNYLANFEGVVGGGVGDPTPTEIGVWKRITLTATAGSTGTCRMLLYPGACGGYLATGGFVLFKNPQVEFDAPGNNPTPFVAGTRSTSQAVLDMTGLNTATVNSLTYNTDGSFSFNGSNITIPFNSSAFTFNSEQTIIIWMKNQSPSTARRNPYNQAYAGAGTITHEYDTNFNYFYGTGGGDNSPYTNHTSPFSVGVGETAMICITRNTSQTAWYKNGVLGNTLSNPYGASVVTGTNNITIGSGYAGSFGGYIYAVQIYNKALSESEVQQNFNALRTRYGV